MFGIIVVQALAGASGGLIRGLVGITKAKEFNPTTFKFEWKIFGFTILVSMLTGLMSGLIMNVEQVKDILEQPNISTSTVQNLPTKEKVKRVINGDTIELVNGQIVRYVGVTLEYDTYTSDRFGRALAYPFVNGKNVATSLRRRD